MKTFALTAVAGIAAATLALAPAAGAVPSGGTPLHKCTEMAAPPGRDIGPAGTDRDAAYAPVQPAPAPRSYVDVTC